MLRTKKYALTTSSLLTNEVLNVYINNFWNEVFSPLIKSEDKHLMLLCKVEFSDSTLGYRTLGQLRKVNFSDKKLFIIYLTERLGQLTDAYTTHPINKIIFSYMINKGIATETSLHKSLTEVSIPTHRFNNMNLPISMNPSDYGKIISKSVTENYIRFVTSLEKRVFQIDISLDGTTNNTSIFRRIRFKMGGYDPWFRFQKRNR